MSNMEILFGDILFICEVCLIVVGWILESFFFVLIDKFLMLKYWIFFGIEMFFNLESFNVIFFFWVIYFLYFRSILVCLIVFLCILFKELVNCLMFFDIVSIWFIVMCGWVRMLFSLICWERGELFNFISIGFVIFGEIFFFCNVLISLLVVVIFEFIFCKDLLFCRLIVCVNGVRWILVLFCFNKIWYLVCEVNIWYGFWVFLVIKLFIKIFM